MKFLLSNNTGYRNKGCEAIAESVIAGMSKLNPDSTFDVLTDDFFYDSFNNLHSNVTFFNSPFKKFVVTENLSFTPKWWYYNLLDKSGISSTVRKCLNIYRQSDAVLALGGDVFSSIYGDLDRHLAQIFAAHKIGKPVFVVGQSIGPFTTQKEYRAFKKVANCAQLVTVRDIFSLNYLAKMNLKTQVHLVADPAFCLEPDMLNLERIFECYNVPKDKPLVGLVPSQGITSFSGYSSAEHLQILKQVLFFLINDMDCHVILIPHGCESLLTNNDRYICELLYRATNFSKNVTFMNFNHSAREIRAIFSKFDLLITERMHAAIAGFSQNVPTFMVGYSIKAEGLFNEVYPFGCIADYLVPISKLDSKTLNKKIAELFINKNKIVEQLKLKIPLLKERAFLNFVLIDEFLKKGIKSSE